MRTASLLLAFTLTAFGGEEHAETFHTFEAACKQVRSPGIQPRLVAAIDAMVATDDARAIRPVAGFLVTTLMEERDAFTQVKTVQQVGARALEQKKALAREISHLKLKERAGDAEAGPEMERRHQKIRQLDRDFAQAGTDIARLGRLIDFLRKLRTRLVDGTAALIMAQPDAQAEVAYRYLRQAFDLNEEKQALHLVQVLGRCKRPQTEQHLVTILLHPKATSAVRKRACHAIVPVISRAGASALLQLVRDDAENTGPHALHALSLAARRRLGDADEAAAFVESFGE